MSIDDDFYDVEAAVKGKPEQEAFNRFSQHTSNLEIDVDELRKENSTLRGAFKILNKEDLT